MNTTDVTPTKARVAFVTVGQSPRPDILDEIGPMLGADVEIIEVGALDGMSRQEIDKLAPKGDEPRLSTLLRDGSEVITTKAWTRDRLQVLMDDLDRNGVDLIVLMCTGYFEGLHTRTLMVEAQGVVDRTVEALAEGKRQIGVLVPLEEQTREFALKDASYRPARVTHASPYSDRRLREAGKELAEVDFIVMHCMGYTAEMHRQVRAASGRPALLARRLLANAVGELIR